MEDDALQDPEELTRYCSLVVSNPRAARRMLPEVEQAIMVARENGNEKVPSRRVGSARRVRAGSTSSTPRLYRCIYECSRCICLS